MKSEVRAMAGRKLGEDEKVKMKRWVAKLGFGMVDSTGL